MGRGGYRVIVLLLTWAAVLQGVHAKGKLDIKFISSHSSGRDTSGHCCDVICSLGCDPFFTICIDHTSGSNNMGDCAIYRRTTGVFQGSNEIIFGASMQGVANPIMVPLEVVPEDFVMKVLVTDRDPANAHDTMDYIITNIRGVTPGNDGNIPAYRRESLKASDRLIIFIDVRSYCDRHYFGPSCTTRCMSNEFGHYDCNKITGEKICALGWTGRNCSEDINECNRIDCQNGATCRNMNGSYECQCVQGFEGWHCETAKHECAIKPCKNGGTCYLNGTDGQHTCDCLPLYGGPECEEVRDPCAAKPCFNNATCLPSNTTSSGFFCSCESHWTGELCDVRQQTTTAIGSTTKSPAPASSTKTPIMTSSSSQIVFGDPFVITLLGVIDQTNHRALEGGLEHLIRDLGGVGSKVHVKAEPTVIPLKPEITTTRVKFFYASDDGPIDHGVVRDIFRVNGDDTINSYLPLPIYRPGFDPAVKEAQTAIERGPPWYAIAIPVLVIIIIVACILAFILIRRRKTKENNKEFLRCDSNVTDAGPPQTNMAFENVLYRETHRQRDSDVLDGGAVPNGNPARRELPPIGACAEEANPYCSPVQYDTPVKRPDGAGHSAGQYQNSNMAVLDTRCEAGANDYTDFGNLEGAKAKEENTYQELDDVMAAKIALSVGLPDDLKQDAQSDLSVSMDSDEEDDIDKIKASFKEDISQA